MRYGGQSGHESEGWKSEPPYWKIPFPNLLRGLVKRRLTGEEQGAFQNQNQNENQLTTCVSILFATTGYKATGFERSYICYQHNQSPDEPHVHPLWMNFSADLIKTIEDLQILSVA